MKQKSKFLSLIFLYMMIVIQEKERIMSKEQKAKEKAQAIAKAKQLWKGKDPDGLYVCDGCNGPLEFNEEGSSLIGSYLR
jgi:hypothetical protein